MNLNRRNFLKFSGLAALAIPFLASLRGSNAVAADPTPALVPEDDATAKALGYCQNAKKADKCPDRKAKDKATQFCRNCQLYTKTGGEGDKEFGKCLMIAKGPVSAGGWCKSWVKNPKL